MRSPSRLARAALVAAATLSDAAATAAAFVAAAGPAAAATDAHPFGSPGARDQRVLLHRGRSTLRQALESEFGDHDRAAAIPAAPCTRLPTGGRARDRLPGGCPDPAGPPPIHCALATCPHCTEYLAQMRATIAVTGTLTPDDLTPQMQAEFIALYRRWRADQRP